MARWNDNLKQMSELEALAAREELDKTVFLHNFIGNLSERVGGERWGKSLYEALDFAREVHRIEKASKESPHAS